MHSFIGLAIILFAARCTDAVTIERDITALKLIREEVRGRDPYWNGVIESWTDDTDPCGESWEGNWLGVECRYQGDVESDIRQVTNIHLPDRKLGGPVPMGISLLRSLIELDLDGNNLSGPMNPYLGCLGNMRELDLANNSLWGTIPTEWRFLTNLEEAELEVNPSLTGCVPQGLPPTTTVCREIPTATGLLQPICELIGIIVSDTGVQGFCPSIPNIEKRCPDAAFVQQFINSGKDYNLYFQSQGDSSMAGQVDIANETKEVTIVTNEVPSTQSSRTRNPPTRQERSVSRSRPFLSFMNLVLG